MLRVALLPTLLLVAACGGSPEGGNVTIEGLEEVPSSLTLDVEEDVPFALTHEGGLTTFRTTESVRLGFGGPEPADGLDLGSVAGVPLRWRAGRLVIGGVDRGPLPSGATLRLASEGVFVDGERRADLPAAAPEAGAGPDSGSARAPGAER